MSPDRFSNTSWKGNCSMSTAYKVTVFMLVFSVFIPLQGCKNGPPPVMLARRLLKHNKDENLGQIAPGSLLKLEKSAVGTATVGEDFRVSLESRSGDGHAWRCRTTNDPYLLVDSAFETEPKGTVASGNVMQAIYQLHARAAGKAKIEFALFNVADENNAPSQTVTLEVEVTGPASK